MRRTDRTLVLVTIAALSLGASARSVAAQAGGVMLQGVASGEFWSTNSTSNLLTRNDGHPGTLGRMDLWGAWEPISRVVIYGAGEWAKGDAKVSEDLETYSNQFGIRYTQSNAFVVDVGRLTPIVGTFSSRHLVTRNPLIGEPDGYSTDYPLGAKVYGEFDKFDYRVGLLSLPTAHIGYEPPASQSYRPAVGAGVTLIPGLRLGGSFTEGSYVNDQIPAAALDGRSWQDFHEQILAFDGGYSHGYLETHVEAARGRYDVPTGSITGITYYGEVKYTFTPRFFVATRIERNDYPFIRPGTATSPGWFSKLVDFEDGEVGVGYRITSGMLAKASYRADRWWVNPANGFRGTGGHALAFQLSQAFDALSWMDRPQ